MPPGGTRIICIIYTINSTCTRFPAGLDLYYADAVQPLTTACEELHGLDEDLIVPTLNNSERVRSSSAFQ